MRNNLPKQVDKKINSTGIKLTKQQAEVLNLIITYKESLTAHEILIELRKINPKANRMTIYRSLEHLVKINIIHKIDCNNTYKLCSQSTHYGCQIFICEVCNKQLEIHSDEIENIIKNTSNLYQFHISNPIQIKGKCIDCYMRL
jgi:Fe2+ or Zn2+ uptake regulation protein